MHEFTKGSPWDELGIDLCLGAEADKQIDIRQQMFAPFYMRYFAQDAYIQTQTEADGLWSCVRKRLWMPNWKQNLPGE